MQAGHGADGVDESGGRRGLRGQRLPRFLLVMQF